MRVVVVASRSLGERWLSASRAILEDGAAATYDGQSTRAAVAALLDGGHPSTLR
jgi:hypothetical protein